ncbi:peptidase propeptide and ypeb domain-containing protein [Acidovorax sp. NO-1]|nr:peptidase propeptide and ypeb domain-containing protein [Acidovorax sp. NO-1]
MKGLFIGRSDFAQDNAPMLFSFHAAFADRQVRRMYLVGCVLCAAAMAVAPAGAASGRDDHDRARQAVQAGQVLPLPTVLERLQREVPGQVLEVELEQERDRWIYEIKLLTPAGQLTKVKLDARTAEVLRVKPRESREDRR